ncbi:unnamed protein product, partial [Durusdinium trenchii]
DPLGTFAPDLARRRLQRTGSGALAEEGEHPVEGEAEDEEDDDFDNNVDGFASEGPREAGAWPRAPKCALASYALGSLHRKIPRMGARVDLEAESLIAQATNPDELAQMYEGWTSWI